MAKMRFFSTLLNCHKAERLYNAQMAKQRYIFLGDKKWVEEQI